MKKTIIGITSALMFSIAAQASVPQNSNECENLFARKWIGFAAPSKLGTRIRQGLSFRSDGSFMYFTAIADKRSFVVDSKKNQINLKNYSTNGMSLVNCSTDQSLCKEMIRRLRKDLSREIIVDTQDELTNATVAKECAKKVINEIVSKNNL